MKRFLVMIFLFALLAVGFSFVALQTDFFYLNKISIEGFEVLTAEEIIKASGLKKNINILFIGEREVEENIKMIPRVETVNVKKVYPNQIAIFVKERNPSFQVETETGYGIVDRKGVEYEQTMEPKTIPILRLSGNLVLEREVILKVIADILEDDQWRATVEQVDYDSEEIKINTIFGISVVFHADNDIQYSVKFAQKILLDLVEKDIHDGTIHFYKDTDPVYLPSEEVLQ